MTYTYECPECGTEHDGDFTPERAAPFCMNHDDPKFGDPGEGADWDGAEVCENCGCKFNMEKIIDKAYEKYADEDEGYDGPDTVEEARGEK